jgi:multidrug efflux pump subunit AcrB
MLLITGTELNVSSAMGFILLIGLVVKNGIVMIDYAHHCTRAAALPGGGGARGAHPPAPDPDDDAVHALRPAAAGPGTGAGAELQKPLALVVIGGLSLSTLVTLFAVPTFYVGLRRRSEDKSLRRSALGRAHARPAG